MPEQRHHPRLSYAREVWIGQDGIFSRTNERLANISVGGVFLQTAASYAKGAILNIRFKVGAEANFISSSAIVRNLRPGLGIGLEFLDLSPEAKQDLAAFITQELAKT